jgi:hypothetical protein
MVTRAQHLTAAESDWPGEPITAAESDFVHSQHCHEPQLSSSTTASDPQDLLDHTLRTVSRLCLQGLPGAHRAI